MVFSVRCSDEGCLLMCLVVKYVGRSFSLESMVGVVNCRSVVRVARSSVVRSMGGSPEKIRRTDITPKL